jgi:hypothetical protein
MPWFSDGGKAPDGWNPIEQMQEAGIPLDEDENKDEE